jgi:hypothetical protein
MSGRFDDIVVLALDHIGPDRFEALGAGGRYRACRFGRDAIPKWARRMHVAPDTFRAITEVFRLDPVEPSELRDEAGELANA